MPMDRIAFPPVVPGSSREPEFQNPGLAFSSDFFGDLIAEQPERIIYTTDSRGRVLTETRFDENGELIGELRNTWTGDRLDSVLWKSGDDERLTEYEYDSSGNRILERNLNRGILERIVRTTGNRDIEELYMNGRVVLRAVWEDGRKISEERVR
jgi:YD repeat-containing protein